MGYVGRNETFRYEWASEVKYLTTAPKNIIPASEFLKPSKKQRYDELQKALSLVGEELSQHRARLEALEVKNRVPQTHTDIKVDFENVTAELTELPEKWCVKLTKENYKSLKTGDELDSYIEPYGYHHSDKVNAFNNWEEHICTGYTEITFEQFQKWVLPSQPETKEIDWSKAGQLVEFKYDKNLYTFKVLTSGHTENTEGIKGFGGTDIATGEYKTDWICDNFTLCTESVTLKNE
jgi:hypothetical protein